MSAIRRLWRRLTAPPVRESLGFSALAYELDATERLLVDRPLEEVLRRVVDDRATVRPRVAS